jgi:hypothetical protein
MDVHVLPVIESAVPVIIPNNPRPGKLTHQDEIPGGAGRDGDVGFIPAVVVEILEEYSCPYHGPGIHPGGPWPEMDAPHRAIL